MIRRRVIRGLVLALLTLCVAAWVVSYGYAAALYHRGPAASEFAAVQSGRINFGAYPVGVASPPWRYEIRPIWHERHAGGMGFPWLGFYLLHGLGVTEIGIPLWFPTLLSALLLWLVWRKTRPKYSGRGFPVEVVKKAEGPSVP